MLILSFSEHRHLPWHCEKCHHSPCHTKQLCFLYIHPSIYLYISIANVYHLHIMLFTLFLLNACICPICTFGQRIFASPLESYIIISSSLIQHTFHSPWQMPSPLIYITNSSIHTSYSFKCLFFFHYIRQIINPHLKGLPQPILPYNILHAIKTDLCSSTDARLGYDFKQSTFITFSSCSSSALSSDGIPSSSHKTISLLFIQWVQTRKSFVASSWLAEITAYHSAQQCLDVCSIAMHLS